MDEAPQWLIIPTCQATLQLSWEFQYRIVVMKKKKFIFQNMVTMCKIKGKHFKEQMLKIFAYCKW